jgi:hypothetical protein
MCAESRSIHSQRSRVAEVEMIFPWKRPLVSCGRFPLWSMWAWERMTLWIVAGSIGSTRLRSNASFRGPW